MTHPSTDTSARTPEPLLSFEAAAARAVAFLESQQPIDHWNGEHR